MVVAKYPGGITVLSYHDCIVRVMKMRNIVPRAGIEPTTLAFRARVLTIIPPRLFDVTTIPTSTCLCGSLPERSLQTTTFVRVIMYDYM